MLSLLHLRRRWYASRLEDGPLRRFYQQPFARGAATIDALPLLAVDLETTGLDADSDTILSVGWVPVDGLSIRLGGARHQLVRQHEEINESSVALHAITDDMAAGGEPLCSVLQSLLEALSGRVLVVHNAQIEQSFLDRACRRCFGGPFIVPTIDTLQLALRRLRRREQAPRSGELRLAALREQYGLPRYKAHNALTDALAGAELFLAQQAHWAGDGQARLKHFCD